MGIRQICCPLLLTAVVSSSMPVADAQDGKDIARGFLRALIESQLEKQRRRSERPDPFGDTRRAELHPGRQTAEMQRLQPMTAAFAQESATLTALLNTDARRSFEVRRYLADALQLNAAATALAQQAARAVDHRQLAEACLQLHNEWLTLSHQLSRSGGLSAETRACLKRIEKIDRQIAGIYGFGNAFSGEELLQEVRRLETHIHDLDEDVNRYAAGSVSGLGRVRRELGRNHQQVAIFERRLSEGRASLEEIVRDYQQIYRTWQSLQGELRQFQGYHIVRNVRRIQESHQRIHSLLGLEMSVDREVLLQIVHETHDRLRALSSQITLEQLMYLPDAGAVPAAMADVDGMIENLDSVLHLKENPQAIADAWAYADEAWNVLAWYLAPLRDGAVQSQIATISQSLQTMKEALGVTVAFDRAELRKMAHQLEEQADLLVSAIRDWQKHPGKHDPRLLANAQNLVGLCHELEVGLWRGRSEAECRNICDQMAQLWQQIRPELLKCDTDERPVMDHIAATFTPGLIRLRTMMGD